MEVGGSYHFVQQGVVPRVPWLGAPLDVTTFLLDRCREKAEISDRVLL